MNLGTRADIAPRLGPVAAESYRPDIDGLRAVAVLAVVLFHAGVPAVGGGFVGVDIFFVISGFLISGIIFQAIDRGDFSFRRFYVRRIRRLLPAFAVTLLATVVAGLFISLPRELMDLGQSLVASSVFATNALFWHETGYFAGPAEIKPLLHTWSLAVEEQFYLTFPLLFLLLAKASTRVRIAIVVALLAGSLLLSEWMVGAAPSAAFYLLPARAWELLLGTAMALVLPKVRLSRGAAAWLALAGLALALAPAFLMDRSSRFPGFGALPACLGAALVILAGAAPSPAQRLLASAPMVFVGKISYSLYLWHWPIFAYLAYVSIDEPSPIARAVAVVAAFVLATLSWRFVEQPFRDRERTPRFRPFVATAVSSLLMAAVGAVFVHMHGLTARLPDEVNALLAQGQRHRTPGCMAELDRWVDPAAACVFPADAAGDPTIAVWGDSHAHALIEEMGRQAGADGRALRFYGYSGCPPVPGFSTRGRGRTGDCNQWNDAVLAAIEADRDLRTVFIAARHAVYLKGFTGRFGPAENEGGLEIGMIDPADGRIDAPEAGEYFRRLDAVVSRLQASGKRVVLQLPVPEVAYDVPVVLALRYRAGLAPDSFTRPRAMYEERQADVRAALLAIADARSLAVVDPAAFLCDRRACRVAVGTTSLYADDDHLSDAGVRVLMEDIRAKVLLP